MFNKKLLQIICLLCVVACLVSMFGCSKEKPNDAIVTYPEDVSTITDFKCVCSTDHETEFVIEDEEAKALYTYIMEQWEKAEETEIDRTEQDDIYLSFQDGDPSQTTLTGWECFCFAMLDLSKRRGWNST